MAAFTYSYSNSLGETFYRSNSSTNQISVSFNTIYTTDAIESSLLSFHAFTSSTNVIGTLTGSTSFSKDVKETIARTSYIPQEILLDDYDTYYISDSVSEDKSYKLFSFIKNNSETVNYTINYSNTITGTFNSNPSPYTFQGISGMDVSISSRSYFSFYNYANSSNFYLMSDGIYASMTFKLRNYAASSGNLTNYYPLLVVRSATSVSNSVLTSSTRRSLYSSFSLITTITKSNSETASSRSSRINYGFRRNSYTLATESTIGNATDCYKNTNTRWQSIVGSDYHETSWLNESSTTSNQEIERNTSLLLETSINFNDTTVDTLLYDSDGYLQGYKIAGSIKGVTNGNYIFFGTSVLETYVATPWNVIQAHGTWFSSETNVLYATYDNRYTSKNVYTYETSVNNVVTTDATGITEQATYNSYTYMPEVSYLKMNMIGTSYKGLGMYTTDNINSSTAINTYAFSDAIETSVVDLYSSVDGDCYEYYTTVSSYKYIQDVTTYDKTYYVESAIKTTYSEAKTVTTYTYDYNGSYDTETVYNSYYSSQDYTTTRTDTIFTDTIYSSSFSYNSVTYVSSKFGHGTNVSTMTDVSSSSVKSFSASNKNGYTMLDSTMYMNTTSEKKDVSVLETRLSQQVKTYTTESVISNTTTYIGTDGIDNNTVLMQLNEPITYSGSFIVSVRYNSLTLTSSYYNTTDFGTTFRNSSLVSSTENININNEYLTMDRIFNYNITSAWAYDTVISTISKYSTILQTTFKISYDTRTNYNSYSYTNIATTTAYGTSDRFINLVGVSRFSTYTVSNTNTVAYYNGSTMATITSTAIEDGPRVTSSSSVINYTFITSIDDYSSSTDLASTESSSLANKQFMNSITQLVSSTMEQQNDTLVFKSEIATYSTFRLSTSFSTSSTININYEATTYTDEYNPISYTTTSIAVTSSLTVSNSIESITASSTVTQAVNYTPIYSTVNGVYITG